MPTLNIRFDAYAADAGNAVVPVDVISSAGKRLFGSVMTLNQPQRVEVPENGLYLVRLHLPNGELVEEQINVTAETESHSVLLRPLLSSPQESFGWAFYLRGGPRSVLAAPSKEPAGRKWLFRGFPVWNQGQTPPKFFLRLWKAAGGTDSPVPTLVSGPVNIANGVATDFSLGSATTPRVLQVVWQTNTGDRSHFLIVPPNDESIESSAIVTARVGLPLDVTIRFARPEAEALLTFLTHGDLPSVRRVWAGWGPTAESLLDGDSQSPMAAVISAICLFRTGDSERLFDRPILLAKKFPALPDASVLAGWHLMRTAKRAASDEAAEFFIAALEAGVPALTATLRLLNDGLNVLRAMDFGGERLRAASETARHLVRSLVSEPTSVATFEQSVAASDAVQRRFGALR